MDIVYLFPRHRRLQSISINYYIRVISRLLKFDHSLKNRVSLTYTDKTRQDKTRQDNCILIRLHRVQYGENINKIDSQSVFCSGSWRSIQYILTRKTGKHRVHIQMEEWEEC